MTNFSSANQHSGGNSQTKLYGISLFDGGRHCEESNQDFHCFARRTFWGCDASPSSCFFLLSLGAQVLCLTQFSRLLLSPASLGPSDTLL